MLSPRFLEEGLNDFAVIRTTLESRACFSEGDPLIEEHDALIGEARERLLNRAQAWKTEPLPIDYDKMRTQILNLMQRGKRSDLLNGMMKLNLFDAANAPLYRYSFRRAADNEEAEGLPAPALVARLFQDLEAALQDEASFADNSAFDLHVFQKYVALLSLFWANANPFFFERRL